MVLVHPAFYGRARSLDLFRETLRFSKYFILLIIIAVETGQTELGQRFVDREENTDYLKSI